MDKETRNRLVAEKFQEIVDICDGNTKEVLASISGLLSYTIIEAVNAPEKRLLLTAFVSKVLLDSVNDYNERNVEKADAASN